MKLIVAMLFACFLQLHANTFAQTVTISNKEKHIIDVFREIKKQTGYNVICSSAIIKEAAVNRINFQNLQLTEALQVILEPKGLTYEITDKNIVIKKKPELAVVSKLKEVEMQQNEVTGQVRNQGGESLIGVSVVVKGKSRATASDQKGQFRIAANAGETLVFSSIGFITKEVLVSGAQTLSVIMEADESDLEEVVVVGYGTQKRVNLTGAVTTISNEVFENKSASTPLAALQGAMPGVGITRTSGKPGAENYNIQIRGSSSINNVNVLVIVDGVRGSFNELNPSDIESLTVLKDAAAAAIYGSNAAGGVVLITTKKGKKSKVEVNYSGNYGVTHAARMPHRLKSWDEAKYYDEAMVNSAGTLIWGDIKYAWMKGEKLDVIDTIGIRTGVRPSDFFPGERFVIDPDRPNVWLSYSDVDQIDVAMRKTNPIQSHNLSLRGGNDKTTYYLSGGYFNRQGVLRYATDKEDKYNLRLNLGNKLSDKIYLNTFASYTNNNVYQPVSSAESLITSAYKLWGWEEPYRPTGEYHVSNGIWASSIQLQKDEGKNNRKNYLFEGSANLKISDLLSGLDVDVIGSKRIGTGKGHAYRRTLNYIGAAGAPIVFNPANSVSRSSTADNFTSLQAFATYNLDLQTDHHFKVLGGYSFEDFRFESMSGGVSNLVSNDFYSLNWGDPQTASVSDGISTAATMGFFGRFNYNYAEKYLFETNVRYDGSSRLAPENRWKLFPSLSAGWVISNESFFPKNEVVSNLKIRASWGQLGNSDALGYYDYIGLLNSRSDVPINNARNVRIYQSQLESPKKAWEIIETSNLGLDVSFLRNRLRFTGDYYVKRNKNMLANIEVPSIIGVGLSTYNVGELKTWGWEMNAEWRDGNDNFKYWISANLSDNKNELVKYTGRNIVYGGQVGLIEGMPLNTIWGYKTDGLFQSNQEYADYGVFINSKTGQGDMKYLDLNGDKKINAGNGTLEDHGDLVLLGDDNPRYMFGLNLGLSWKNFGFSTFLQGVAKRSFFMNNADFQPMLWEWKMPFAEQIDYWTPENPNAFWPRPYANSDHSYLPSDYWVQNAAYIRLKNVELSYTMPKTLIQKAGINSLRISFSAQDVFESTKTFSFVNPEYPNNSGNAYPFFRTFQMGLNVTF